MVCRPKKNGGLGILNLKVQNDAMLLKLMHKFYNKLDVPWVHLIWDTYYASTVPHAAAPCGSFWWHQLVQLMPVYRGVAKVQIGAGDTVLFWKDDWNNSILSDTYPRAFSYTSDEDTSVRKVLSITHLNQAFELPLSVQDFEELRALQQNVQEVGLTDSKGVWICTWGSAVVTP